MKDVYISREDLEDFIKIFDNAFDKVYSCMLFEGFLPEQILMLKSSDIVKGMVKTYDGEVKPISEKTLEYILAANSQEVYYVYNHLSDGLIAKKLLKEEYVIKFVDKDIGRSLDLEMKHRRMQRRLYKTQRVKKNTTLFTEKEIYYSGLITELLPLAREFGSIEAAYNEDRQRFMNIAKRWNQEGARTISLFRNIYGDLS